MQRSISLRHIVSEITEISKSTVFFSCIKNEIYVLEMIAQNYTNEDENRTWKVIQVTLLKEH